MKFDKIRIVLVSPSHPGNIGATARAMKTMGLSRLYLVNPVVFPHQQAHELAAGADDILEEAVVVQSLGEALVDCHLVLATSARARELSLPVLNPCDAASLVAKTNEKTEVAIVFGRERTGLTNEELLHAHYHIHIPTDVRFSSLNLAQSVQIIAYELRLKCIKLLEVEGSVHAEAMATADEVERFYEHLRSLLVAIDFLKPSNPKKLMFRLRRLFNRTKLEDREIHILRGILTQIEKILPSHEGR